MNINPLSANLVNLLSPSPAIGVSAGDNNLGTGRSDVSFSNILSDALVNATQLDQADRPSG